MSNAAEKRDFHTQKELAQLKLNYFTHILYNNADSSLTFFFFFPPNNRSSSLVRSILSPS